MKTKLTTIDKLQMLKDGIYSDEEFKRSQRDGKAKMITIGIIMLIAGGCPGFGFMWYVLGFCIFSIIAIMIHDKNKRAELAKSSQYNNEMGFKDL